MFDKTGTLTAGKPQVASITMLSTTVTQDEMLQLAAAVERQATHPVARAVVLAAQQAEDASSASSSGGGGTAGSNGGSKGGGGGSSSNGSKGSSGQQAHLQVLPGSFLQEPGSGAVALVGGRRVAVGTIEWVARQQAAAAGEAASAAGAGATAEHAATAAAAAAASSSGRSAAGAGAPAGAAGAAAGGGGSGVTQVYVSIDGVLVGSLRVADQIRPDARATIEEMHKQGLRTIMLSGVCAAAGERGCQV